MLILLRRWSRFAGGCLLLGAMAWKFYVISREMSPAPVPGTRGSRPQPRVADRQPKDAGDCAGPDAPQWRPLGGSHNRASVQGPAVVSAPLRLARWPAGGALAPHVCRRRRFVESAGEPGASLQEGQPRPNRAGDSRPRDGARRRRPSGSTPQTTAGRGAPHGGHAAVVQLVSQRSRASADSGETSNMASGCRRNALLGMQDSVSAARACDGVHLPRHASSAVGLGQGPSRSAARTSARPCHPHCPYRRRWFPPARHGRSCRAVGPRTEHLNPVRQRHPRAGPLLYGVRRPLRRL